eukprot:GHVL01010663.1.p1 GENE.GHVL01010663.1~~GHVL01010663.1.p1  ORF type:complete len:174 (+),score=19.59 GHVL01010663.1:35-556(+)
MAEEIILTNTSQQGVIYIGHLPQDFAEHQINKFFSQFGDILRFRLARNPKSAQSRHYAFIQFESDEVAKVVAEAMDGHLINGKKLRVHVVDAKAVHEGTFGQGKRLTNQTAKRRQLCIKKHNKWATQSLEGNRKRILITTVDPEKAHKILESDKRRKRCLQKLGIDVPVFKQL